MGKGSKERLCPLGRVAMRRPGGIAGGVRARRGSRATRAVQPARRRLTVRAVQRMLKRYLALAGLPLDLTPHKLRHATRPTCSTRARTCALVQELLGHAQLVTTQVYTHVSIARLKDVYNRAHPRA